MRKFTKNLIAVISIVLAILVVFVFKWGENKFPDLPKYSGAKNLQEQTLNNGKTRIVTFQVNEESYKVGAKYSSDLSSLGWSQRVMASSNKTTSYTMEYITESVVPTLFGLRLTGGTCPNFLLYMNAKEDDKQVTTVTVRQEVGSCSR